MHTAKYKGLPAQFWLFLHSTTKYKPLVHTSFPAQDPFHTLTPGRQAALILRMPHLIPDIIIRLISESMECGYIQPNANFCMPFEPLDNKFCVSISLSCNHYISMTQLAMQRLLIIRKSNFRHWDKPIKNQFY